MTYLRVRNFSELQHYSDRPDNPWIKFYVRVLDDEELNALPIATRLLWTQLLLLAQRFANVIPSDPERLAGLTGIPTPNVREGVKQLVKGAWLTETDSPRRASKRASNGASNSASPRARATEADTDTEKSKPVRSERSEATPALTDITQPRPTSKVPGAQRILDQCDVIDANTVPAVELYCTQLANHPNIILLVEEKLLCFDSRDTRKSKTALAIRLLQDAVAKLYTREIA